MSRRSRRTRDFRDGDNGNTHMEDAVSETEESKSTQSKANKFYSRATTKLRTKYRDEFESLLEEEYRAAGEVYKKRLTPEEREEKEKREKREKAIAELEAIYAEHPELRPTSGTAMVPNTEVPYGGAHPISPEDQAKVPSRAEVSPV